MIISAWWLRTSSKFSIQEFRGVASFARSGGAKLKSGGQRFSPISEGFFWPKSQIFRPKADDLQNKIKKRSSPKSESFFCRISQILTFFPPKNTNFFLPKKYRGGKKKIEGAKTKIGGTLPPAPPLATRLQEFEEIHNIGSLETPKQVRIPPITK